MPLTWDSLTENAVRFNIAVNILYLESNDIYIFIKLDISSWGFCIILDYIQNYKHGKLYTRFSEKKLTQMPPRSANTSLPWLDRY